MVCNQSLENSNDKDVTAMLDELTIEANEESLPYICLLFSGFSNVFHFACVWPTALKLGCITNFDMLFLAMGFISFVDEIQFMLIDSRHICIRSIRWNKVAICQ